MEVISRELLLLRWFDFEVPFVSVQVYFEVFGNVLVKVRTSRYMERLGYEMRSLIVDGSGGWRVL